MPLPSPLPRPTPPTRSGPSHPNLRTLTPSHGTDLDLDDSPLLPSTPVPSRRTRVGRGLLDRNHHWRQGSLSDGPDPVPVLYGRSRREQSGWSVPSSVPTRPVREVSDTRQREGILVPSRLSVPTVLQTAPVGRGTTHSGESSGDVRMYRPRATVRRTRRHRDTCGPDPVGRSVAQTSSSLLPRTPTMSSARPSTPWCPLGPATVPVPGHVSLDPYRSPTLRHLCSGPVPHRGAPDPSDRLQPTPMVGGRPQDRRPSPT